LAYYDKELTISRDRYKAGDIARVDVDRLELQRVQYESDLQTADVNLRTAKIQLLQLLYDRTPIDQFDVSGPFDFREPAINQDELHRIALEERPDLKAAAQSVDKAQTDYRLAVANGSTDPTFGMDFGRNPPIPLYMGFNVNIPCAFSIGTRERKPARSWTLPATKSCGMPRNRRCSATSIPLTRHCSTRLRYCGHTKPNIWKRRPVYAKQSRFRFSMARPLCSTTWTRREITAPFR
jgi:hypothetical protein